MNITSYSFQSTYPNQVQVGTPNQQAEVQNKVNQEVENKPNISELPSASQVSTFLEQSKSQPFISADSLSSNSLASQAVSKFTEVNTHLQAISAYK